MDNPTLAVANALINLFFAVNFLVTATQRKLISLYYVSGAFLAMSVGFVFILTKNDLTQIWAGPLFNLMLGLFFLLYFAGVRFYASLANWPTRFWTYLGATLILQLPAVLFDHSYNYRVTAVTGMSILIFIDFLLATRTQLSRLKKAERISIQATLIGYPAYILTRLIFNIIEGTPERFLTDSTTESTVTQFVFLLSSCLFALVINLLDDRKVISMLENQNHFFEHQSYTDQLTGFHNRRYLEKIISDEISRHARYNHPMSMILLDIDHFKKINDQHGHPKGDQVLIELTKMISEQSRSCDISIRMGGEEFMVLMPETDLQGAHGLAERIRTKIESLAQPVFCSYTVSLGVSEMNLDETFDTWYARTDNALYLAKQQGRNRSVLAQQVPAESLMF